MTNDQKRVNTSKFNIRQALKSVGIDVPVDTPLDEYPPYIISRGGSGLSDELIAALTLAYEQGGFGFVEEDLTLHSIDGLFLPDFPPIHTCNVRIDLDAAYDVSNYSSDAIWHDFFTEQGEIKNTSENDLCHVTVNCSDGGTFYGSCWIYEQIPTNSDPVCAIGVCDLPGSGIGPFKLVWLEDDFTAEKMGS